MVGNVFFSRPLALQLRVRQSEVRLRNGHVTCESCLLVSFFSGQTSAYCLEVELFRMDINIDHHGKTAKQIKIKS